MTSLFNQTASSESIVSSQDDFFVHTMQDDILGQSQIKQNSSTTIEKNSVSSPLFVNKSSQKPALEKTIQSTSSPFITKQENSSSQPATEITESIKPQQKNNDAKEKSFSFKLILILIVIFTISIIILGSYYFWISRESNQVTEPIIQEVPAIEAPAPIINTPIEKYSKDKPNYLVLDFATLPFEEIKKNISATANEIKATNTITPYEFIVVDSNNNPVAFPIFITATNIKLSPNTLSALGSDFSLFFYNDNGNMHVSIASSINDKDLLDIALPIQEKTLSTDIESLFLDLKPDLVSETFKDGSYGNHKTRYLNLSSQGLLSIDYAITETKFILSTSKNTLRAVIDTQSALQQLSNQTGTDSFSN